MLKLIGKFFLEWITSFKLIGRCYMLFWIAKRDLTSQIFSEAMYGPMGKVIFYTVVIFPLYLSFFVFCVVKTYRAIKPKSIKEKE